VHDNVSLVDDSTSFINRSEIEEALKDAEKPEFEEPAPEEPVHEETSHEDTAPQEAPLIDELLNEPVDEEAIPSEEAAEEGFSEEPSEEPQEGPAEEASAEQEEDESSVLVPEEEVSTEEYIVEEPAEEEKVEEEHPEELTREDLGYNIAFNTTISCLITNAALTKSQANKLASILHDAYARAIKPVHGTLDGDTVFVLATGKQPVNFDAFAALATDVMQYAIIDGATSATGAYGLPAARDMNKPETE